MTEPNGFLNFNTPEDYLAYQDRLIANWKQYHQYKHLTGNTMLSEIYRQSGRTHSAIKCAVELARKYETKSVVFVTSTEEQNKCLLINPLSFQLFSYQWSKVKFISYDKLEKYLLGRVPVDYVIYDHLVFETCVPTFVTVGRDKTPAEKKWKEIYGNYPYACEKWESFEFAFNLGLECGKTGNE